MSPSLTIVLLSLLLSAVFSGMEIAFLSANKLRIELDKKQGKGYTKIVDTFLLRPSEFISTMLMGNNITLVIYGIAMAKLCDPVIMQYTNSSGTILIIETLFSTLVILFTGEWLPKTVCRINPNWIVKHFSWLAWIFYVLLFPLTKLTSFLARMLIRILGIRVKTKVSKPLFNKADLMHLSNEVSRSQDEENEYEHDIEIFQNALDFSEVRVRECMVPRTEIAALEENQSMDDLLQLFIKTGFSRILVYSNAIDKIIGYVHSKDMFSGMKSIKEKLRPVDFVPETMPAQNLLASLIKNKKALAVVVDEFGGTSGLITMEDIFEEIFGEIKDEHDSDNLIDRKLSPIEFLFSGRAEVKHINKTYNLDIPERDDYETIAGYITYVNESIPQQNEILQFGSFRFRILRTTATKIDLVKLTLVKE
jgi:CBS domain containing-hemolysin-like protein